MSNEEKSEDEVYELPKKVKVITVDEDEDDEEYSRP